MAKPKKTPDQPTVHPGDVVQVTDAQHPLFGGLALVTQTKRWGIGVMVHAFQDGKLVEAYQRLQARPVPQYVVIGGAVAMPTEVLQARKASLDTAAAVAKEAGHG